jgi:DNA primase
MDSVQVVEAIKRRLSLKEVVSRYVALKPAGRGRWKGLCPFHQEKTPSFYVDEEKGLFHCFGCKAGGDLIAFVERIEGLDFQTALERLAEEAGVELPRRLGGERRKELYEVLKLAQAYFQEGLRAHPEAMAYLEGRGLSGESVGRFGLGYAPPKGDGLLTYLSRHGVSPEEGLKAGVLAEKEGRYYDRFRNRITFPIKDHLGRIVAFTGRALGDEAPKYLNSPETPLFRKREVLFAFPEAKVRLREGRAIVVEGLFDAIALHQLGFSETVAVLGSGLSEEQARLLKTQEVREVYLAFDADEAGQKATLQSLDLEMARKFVFYAVRLPVKDPGELLLHPEGRALFQKALEEALPEVEFRFQEAAKGLDLSRPEHKRKVLEALTPRMLSPEPFDPVAERLKALVVKRLGLSPKELADYLQARKRGRPLPPPPPPKAEPRNRTLLLELDVMALPARGELLKLGPLRRRPRLAPRGLPSGGVFGAGPQGAPQGLPAERPEPQGGGGHPPGAPHAGPRGGPLPPPRGHGQGLSPPEGGLLPGTPGQAEGGLPAKPQPGTPKGDPGAGPGHRGGKAHLPGPFGVESPWAKARRRLA